MLATFRGYSKKIVQSV